jgi:hypothetical protein
MVQPVAQSYIDLAITDLLIIMTEENIYSAETYVV